MNDVKIIRQRKKNRRSHMKRPTVPNKSKDNGGEVVTASQQVKRKKVKLKRGCASCY